MKNRLIIIAGPTGVGKTLTAVRLAKSLNTSIINADSRQVFREMNIGTAMPDENEQLGIKHFFLGHRSIHENYDASRYENEVISLLNDWFKHNRQMIMVGGSGLYIDAVCKGIDDLPVIDPRVRKNIRDAYETKGLESIRNRLKDIDPDYYRVVDLNNPQRILKALEVYEITGRPYSAHLTGQPKVRNFEIQMIGLDLPRKLLHERINRRVDQMMSKGLLEEAKTLYEFRHLNALNTVGYRELFDYLDGRSSLNEAIVKIKAHTRQYARRQLTWFRRYPHITWFSPDDVKSILKHVTPTATGEDDTNH